MRTDSKKVLRDYFWLTIIYAASHMMICLISGQWWDDWCYFVNGTEHLKEAYIESGMPLQAYNIMGVMWLPNWGYRIVVFFLFYLSGLLFYEIIRNIEFMSNEDVFWISAIAMTVPVNDARSVLNCFGYSLTLSLFMIAFFITTKMDKLSGVKKKALRVLSLSILIYSYTTESFLVFTGLIWLYLFYGICEKYNDRKLLLKMQLFLKFHWDYLVLPFAYYIVKGIFFKPYGRYSGYNSVTLKSLIRGIICSPFAALKTGADIVQSYFQQISVISAVTFAIIMTIYLMVNKKDSADKSGISKKKLGYVFLGIIVYYAGIFAYVVVRGGSALRTTGVGGRDSMLAGFGIGIISVGFCRMLPLKRSLQNIIPIALIVLGIFHFNDWYLNYQEDWYHQRQLARVIEENDGFSEDNTILCDFSTASPIGGTRFYSLNGMSYMVTQKMDKFFFSGIEDLKYGLKDIESFTTGGYNCDDYNPSDLSIDGVLFINNASVGNMELLKMRYYEMFDSKKFEEELDSITDYRYVKISKDTSDRIYETYNAENLTSEKLRIIVDNQ